MFTKKRFLLIAALLIAAIGISPLAAQINSFTSNTSKATNGLFGNDTDNFLSVNNWQNVKFNHFFTALQVDEANGVGAGLALKAGAAYLGFGYFGKFWEGNISSTTTEYGDSTTVSNTADLAWTSQISFLLGTNLLGGLLLDFSLAGMGNNNNDKDELNGAEIITSKNTVGLGVMEAGLRWGRNFDLGNGYTFKPNLGFSYNINLQKTVSDPGDGLETTTLTSIDPFFSRMDGYSDIQGGQVGLTGIVNGHAGMGVDLSAKAWDGSLWVGYDLETRTYDKQVTSSSDYWESYDPSYTSHLINVGVGAWYAMDRKLSLGWSVESDFDIKSAQITSVQKEDMPNPDHDFSDTLFKITPKITTGIVFKIKPDAFNFNGSLTLYPLDYSYRKFFHSDLSGVMSNTTTISNTVGTAKTGTSLGFTWFITDGFSFDTAIAAVFGAKVDITAFSVLLSYKR